MELETINKLYLELSQIRTRMISHGSATKPVALLPRLRLPLRWLQSGSGQQTVTGKPFTRSGAVIDMNAAHKTAPTDALHAGAEERGE